jgi:hypothetical protein
MELVPAYNLFRPSREMRRIVMSGVYAGKPPFMSKVVIPESKFLIGAVNGSCAGEVYSNTVSVLILRQYFIYGNGDKFSGSVTKTEFDGCDFSVCVGAGNHLYRDINT